VIFLKEKGLLGIFHADAVDCSDKTAGIIVMENASVNHLLKWYFNNFVAWRLYHRDSVVNMLVEYGLTNKHAVEMVNEVFLELSNKGGHDGYRFSVVSDDFLIRIACPLEHRDELIYGLYLFGKCERLNDFHLAYMFDTDMHLSGVNPFTVFGISIDKARKLLRVLSVDYKQYLSFTDDLVYLTPGVSPHGILRSIKSGGILE